MILVALKDVGRRMWTRYTNDPFKKFEETFKGPAVYTPVEGKESGLAAITHNQPDFEAGVNLVLYGKILYGPVILVNVGDDGNLVSLSEEQLHKLVVDGGLAEEAT